MNRSKTELIMKIDRPKYVNNTQIKNVESYIYVGQRCSTRDKKQQEDIQRRIMAGWRAFTKHRDICKGNVRKSVKRQVYDSCALPAMTYGAETWALTTQELTKEAAAKTQMERSMLKITNRDKKHLVEPNFFNQERVPDAYVKTMHQCITKNCIDDSAFGAVAPRV